MPRSTPTRWPSSSRGLPVPSSRTCPRPSTKSRWPKPGATRRPTECASTSARSTRTRSPRTTTECRTSQRRSAAKTASPSPIRSGLNKQRTKQANLRLRRTIHNDFLTKVSIRESARE
uniref:(northern house mosquito) hypothetical protein n=1 Tax=Culex pipiens TaxID=7175 RepID=A0A8D8NQK2_CULPI